MNTKQVRWCQPLGTMLEIEEARPSGRNVYRQLISRAGIWCALPFMGSINRGTTYQMVRLDTKLHSQRVIVIIKEEQ